MKVSVNFKRVTVKSILGLFLPCVYVGTLSYAFLVRMVEPAVYIGAVGLPIVVLIVRAIFGVETREPEEEKEEAKP